jgi:gas vesicle protein
MTTGMKMLLALLGGAVVGATTALLFAPKSGAELRKEIAAIAREKYQHLHLDELNKLIDKVLNRIKNGTCNCHSREDIEAALDEAAKK